MISIRLRGVSKMSSNRQIDMIVVLGKGLSTPVRAKMLLELSARPYTRLTDLAEDVDEPLQTVSHHLAKLKAYKLVTMTQVGRDVGVKLHEASAALVESIVNWYGEEEDNG